MYLAGRRISVADIVSNVCLATAFAFLVGALAACGPRPVPDLSKISRHQISRTVTVGADTCSAWLPLVVRSEVGQEYLAAALEAAQPWSEATGFALAVPALDGETANVVVSLEPCPAEYVTNNAPYCQRLAQTRQRCESGVYVQTIELFVPDQARLVLILMHELGHAFGLDHVEDAADIMFFAIRAPSELMDGEAGPDAKVPHLPDLPQVVTDADARALRKAWGLE
jgi:hypothetical protein